MVKVEPYVVWCGICQKNMWTQYEGHFIPICSDECEQEHKYQIAEMKRKIKEKQNDT